MAAAEPLGPHSLGARDDTIPDTGVWLVDALGPISPELALVDPELAARARGLLPDREESPARRHPPPEPEPPVARPEPPVAGPEPELPAARPEPQPPVADADPEPVGAERVLRRAVGGVALIGVLMAIAVAVLVWKDTAGSGEDAAPPAAATDEKPLFFSAPPSDPNLTPDAVARLEAQARLQPTSASAREALGTAFLRLRRWKDAEAELRALVALAPNDYFAHFALGRALEEQGRRAEAARHFALADALTGG